MNIFGEDDEPFVIVYTDPYDTAAVDAFHSKITYDIVAASKRQMDLYYQVSLPHYRDRIYLETIHQRYKQFLYAKGKTPDVFLEPSYDIDLFWHAHQLNPLVYKEDMMRIVGYFLNHGASIDHRTEDDKLIADKQSRETWHHLYNESMPIFGGMYRGNQPSGILHQGGQANIDSHCTKMMFENVMISTPRLRKKITLSAWSIMDGKCAEHLFSLKGQNTPRQQNGTMIWKNVSKHILKVTHNSKILILLVAQRDDDIKVMCSNIANIQPLLENSTNMGSYRQINTNIVLDHNIRLDLTICFMEPKGSKTELILELGKYKSSRIPVIYKQFLGPVGLEQYPRGVDSYCEVATHR